MNRLMDRIREISHVEPGRQALWDGENAFSYQRLWQEIELLASRLGQGAGPLGLSMDNGPAWVICDLAAMHAQVATVPIPAFFTDAQQAHTIRNAGIGRMIVDNADRGREVLRGAWGGTIRSTPIDFGGRTQHLLMAASAAAVELPLHTAKITYTSGTTGNPKGVCLSARGLIRVAQSIRQRSQATAQDRHLCITPLSTLLENVAGVYTTLLTGARCCVPPLRTVGLRGSSGLDAAKMLDAFARFDPTTAITTPQILDTLVRMAEAGQLTAPGLRFLAVGGALVPDDLLRRASARGLPVYQGYGLSECASVVCLNGPEANRVGSVGRPLPHSRVALAEDGEILIRGSIQLGYLGAEPATEEHWASGDLGQVDEQGYLYVRGRKRDLIVTAHGRNFSPEWVELALCARAQIAQAAIFGEARPWNVAVLVCPPETAAAAIEAAVAQVNQDLPDYARIGAWLRAEAPFTPANGELTASGMPRRGAIFSRYGRRIESLYRDRIPA